MNTLYIVLFSFFLFGNLYSEESKLSVRTNLGMSSSFHGKRSADILQGTPSRFTHGNIINPEILEKRASSTTFERFYDFADSIFNFKFDKDYILEELVETFYSPSAKLWEGLCDKWSAAAIDHKVIAITTKYRQGLICNDQLFSYGEIKEILSFIYPFDASAKGSISDSIGIQTKVSELRKTLFGSEETTSINLPQFSIDIRNSLGTDDLPPERFKEFLYTKLIKNNGLIIDLDYNHKIQNFPLTGADFEKIKLPEISGKYLKFIPAEIFKPLDEKNEKIINFISTSDEQIKELIGPFASGSEADKNYFTWKNTNNEIVQKFINNFSDNKVFTIVIFNSPCNPGRENFVNFSECFEENNFNYTDIRKILLNYLYSNDLGLSNSIYKLYKLLTFYLICISPITSSIKPLISIVAMIV